MQITSNAEKQTRPNAITVRPFQAPDAPAFRALNEAWISKSFALEPEDVALLGDPQGEILAHGGLIFVAVPAARPDEVVGCFALLPLEGGALRLIRMTVSEERRGEGIGRLLLNHAVSIGRELGAGRMVLETSRKLEAAVRLYESVGFSYLPPVASPIARADLFMELRLNPG